MKKLTIFTVLISVLIGALAMFLIKGSLFMMPANPMIDDDIEINYDPNFKSLYSPTSVETIKIEESDVAKLVDQSILFEKSTNEIKPTEINRLIDVKCWDQRPKGISDLTDGVLIDAYSFDKGDEKKIGFLGFFNVELSDKQKVIVVEYSQEGTQYCDNKEYKYGVGARLMMKVTKSKRNAKLNTPQQITASVIFGRAEVTYSLKTFGITGPGIARLSKTGSLSEDTYQEFLQEISNLIVEMYKKDSQFIVDPKPLPLKNMDN